MKGYDVIISVYDVINKNSSRDSNYILGVIMWPKFGNSSTSIREVIRIWPEKHFFEGWSWLNFNNLELALGILIES